MPTSDNDQTSSDHDGAVKKVVDAFRARRAGHPDAPAPETAAEDAPSTPVVKIQAGQTPGGGDSESPTRAFAIPVVDQTTEEVSIEGVVDENATAEDAPVEAPDMQPVDAEAEAASAEEAPAGPEETGAEETDADPADEDAPAEEAAADEIQETASGIKHQTVVAVAGSAEKAQTPPRADVEAVDPDQVERAGIVESTVDLTPARDEPAGEAEETAGEAETEIIPVPAEAVVAVSGRTPSDDADAPVDDDAPTETIDLKKVATGTAVAAAAAGAAGVAAAAAPAAPPAPAPTAPADQAWSKTPHQPEVIPGAAPAAQEKKTRKWLWALLALIAAAVVAVLIWWFAFANSPQGKVADAAETYQTAMAEGDLAALRGVTCGEEYSFYSSVSEEEFASAYQSQRERGQLFSFKEITGVAVDGDTARVGVDVYNEGDPNATTNAQITLHKVGGEWKVCTTP